MTKEEIQNKIDDLVEKALEADSTDSSEDNIEKGDAKSAAKDEKRPSNGGDDKIKSGSPMSEKEKMMKAKEEAEAAESVEKAEKDKKEKQEEDESPAEEKKEEKKEMKKSEDSDALELDEEEIELVKAWRASKEEESITPEPTPQISEDQITKSMASALEPLTKAIQEKDELIKGLQDKIEKIASQPAYEKRSLDSLESIEKGGHDKVETISKSQTLNRMLELQQEGKGVTSVHIAEFESTNNVSNPSIKRLIADSFKN